MTRKDGLLALLVVVAWGLNFVVIKMGLHNMPPLMLAGLRFLLVAFPALLFVARPKIPLKLLLGYGLTGDRCSDDMKPGAWRRYRCWYRWSGLPAPHCCWMKRSARCNCVAQG